mgnify:CR=1 FL=1
MGNILEKLKSDYESYIYKKNSGAACLKYHFQYNEVSINLYFDMFDIQLPSLSLVLIYNRNYYYTSLNVSQFDIPFQYLNKIPKEILVKILDSNRKLVDFFNKVNDELLVVMPVNASYDNDYDNDYNFSDVFKHTNNKENLPFLYCLRHQRMTDETLNLLKATMSIPDKILKAIQTHNMTVVRTANLKYRKKLTVILKEYNIALD